MRIEELAENISTTDPFDGNEGCLCLGFQSCRIDSANRSALGRRNVGIADQYTFAPQKRTDADKVGRVNDDKEVKMD